MQKWSKKELIADLLVSGNLTEEQVACKADTTIAYVIKTKGILRKEGRLPRPIDARPSSEASVPAAVEHTLDRIEEKMMKRNLDSNNVNPNTLSKVDRKQLYFQFGSGILPNAIIATTGLPSEIVET